jgi:hypothetical protein
MERNRLWTASVSVLALTVMVISRLIYTPRYLYFFDNANFVLAIDHFAPGMHQPQPPGYPLFVLLLKGLDVILHSANRDLVAAGLMGSALGLVLVWFWAASMFGNLAAWIAGGLLLVTHLLSCNSCCQCDPWSRSNQATPRTRRRPST